MAAGSGQVVFGMYYLFLNQVLQDPKLLSMPQPVFHFRQYSVIMILKVNGIIIF